MNALLRRAIAQIIYTKIKKTRGGSGKCRLTNLVNSEWEEHSQRVLRHFESRQDFKV